MVTWENAVTAGRTRLLEMPRLPTSYCMSELLPVRECAVKRISCSQILVLRYQVEVAPVLDTDWHKKEAPRFPIMSWRELVGYSGFISRVALEYALQMVSCPWIASAVHECLEAWKDKAPKCFRPCGVRDPFGQKAKSGCSPVRGGGSLAQCFEIV